MPGLRGVKLRFAVAVDVVNKGRRNHIVGLRDDLPLALPDPHVDEALLRPGKRRQSRFLDCGDDPVIAAQQCHERQRFGHGDGHVPARPMAAASLIDGVPVGQFAPQDSLECFG